jgi:hypothetical protein
MEGRRTQDDGGAGGDQDQARLAARGHECLRGAPQGHGPARPGSARRPATCVDLASTRAWRVVEGKVGHDARQSSSSMGGRAGVPRRSSWRMPVDVS